MGIVPPDLQSSTFNPGMLPAFAAETAEKADSVSFEVLNPEAGMIMASDISLITPRVKDRSDRNIGLIWAGKSGGEFFLDALETVLTGFYQAEPAGLYY